MQRKLKMKQRKIQHEANEQEKLFRWAAYMAAVRPELSLMFHVPNGGSRNKMEAANLKRQGVKPGVPDIFLPVPSDDFHGLFIEMKYGKNTLTDNQKKFISNLKKQGYAVAVCYSCDEAIADICKYLHINF